MKRLIALLVIVLLSTASYAQGVRSGNIYGTVVSNDGEGLPGVTVSLIREDGGSSGLHQVTDALGRFRFLAVSPGSYELKFELEGFETVLREGVPVNLGQSLTLNISMEIASTNSPPDYSAASADPATFWPPNRKFNEIDVVGVNDPDGDSITITITGITQDEPVDGNGTAPDSEGIGTSTARIRAERDGRGNGRIYAISFEAADDEGATCEGAVQVCVSNRGECIDDGQDYSSVDEVSARHLELLAFEVHQDTTVAVDRNIAVGSGHGVTGAPDFFVNGQQLSGAQPVEAFNALIARIKSEAM